MKDEFKSYKKENESWRPTLIFFFLMIVVSCTVAFIFYRHIVIWAVVLVSTLFSAFFQLLRPRHCPKCKSLMRLYFSDGIWHCDDCKIKIDSYIRQRPA